VWTLIEGTMGSVTGFVQVARCRANSESPSSAHVVIHVFRLASMQLRCYAAGARRSSFPLPVMPGLSASESGFVWGLLNVPAKGVGLPLAAAFLLPCRKIVKIHEGQSHCRFGKSKGLDFECGNPRLRTPRGPA
jgi:hypothetical protein